MNFLNLKAVLSLNGSGFALGLKRAESQSKAFAKDIKREFAQAFGVAAITAYSVKLVNLADNITDTAERLDIGTKSLQEWTYAAQRSGSSIERVTAFLESLARARERALGGDKDDISNFGAFGITDFSPNADQLGRQMGRHQGPINRNALQAIGGKGAGELIPTLNALDELSAKAHEAGRILSDETLESLKALKNEAMGLADIFQGPVANAVVFMAERVREALFFVKGSMGALGTFMGTLFGGGSFKEAMEATREANEALFKERQAHADRIKASAANRASLGTGGGTTSEKLHDMTPLKALATKAASSSNLPGLTGWQSAGAAIRFSPDRGVLEKIAKATQDTANNTRQSTRPASFNDLGGGFS